MKKNINRFYMYINLLKISHLSTIFINRKHVPKQEMFIWEPIQNEISIQRKFPSDVLTVLNPMICLLMTYNSKLYIHAQVTPIPNSCREL